MSHITFTGFSTEANKLTRAGERRTDKAHKLGAFRKAFPVALHHLCGRVTVSYTTFTGSSTETNELLTAGERSTDKAYKLRTFRRAVFMA